MSKKHKEMLYRIIFSFLLFAAILVFPLSQFVSGETESFLKLLLFLIPYFIVGGDILFKAARNISHGQVFDENFLMCIATIGAFCIGEYPEGVAVMLFYQTGELFQSYAVNRSRRSISELMDIRPDYANIEQEDGSLKQVEPEEISVGDIIVVKAGEKVPLDGIVSAGHSMLDTSALTGESVPREILEGSSVISGCINQQGLLHIRVTKEFGESTVSKILDMVENASSKKAKAENFITKFARYYTPFVVIAAALLATLPPLLFGYAWSEWIQRGLIFLVISCPCALVISIPLSFFGGIGGASKCGILIKGSNYLEALANTKTVVFDKTGTLTKGTFRVTNLCPSGEVSEEKLLKTAAFAESYSNHPISISLKQAYGKKIEVNEMDHIEELSGFGVKAQWNGKTIFAGNEKLMKKENIAWENSNFLGTIVHVAENNQYLGYIVIADEIKETSFEAIQALKSEGVQNIIMLTGDKKEVGEAVAEKLKLDKVYTELLPVDKVERVEKLLEEKSGKGKLAFVGDGINDAPVLSRADIGIAMGAIGSDAAIEAADIVLMDDNPLKIVAGMKIARKTLRIVKQNIVFALSVKFLVLLLGALGNANMWGAVFADVGVSVIAILNASRALSTKNNTTEKTAENITKKESIGNN